MTTRTIINPTSGDSQHTGLPTGEALFTGAPALLTESREERYMRKPSGTSDQGRCED
jgi:hypothetical protein